MSAPIFLGPEKRLIDAFVAVNLKRGYPLLEIRTPSDVPGDD